MSDAARQRILARLAGAVDKAPEPATVISAATEGQSDRRKLIDGLKTRMQAVHTEVHVAPAEQWIVALSMVLVDKKVESLLYDPDSDMGTALYGAREKGGLGKVDLVAYPQPVKTGKAVLFQVDAGITTATCAVADPGALMLRSGVDGPRSLSLVPPVHIAVLDAVDIYPDMSTAMFKMQRAREMPANLVLISGPSKTADIEFTLTFGVHGPKEVVVIIRT